MPSPNKLKKIKKKKYIYIASGNVLEVWQKRPLNSLETFFEMSEGLNMIMTGKEVEKEREITSL